VSLTTRGQESTVPARKEETIFSSKGAETEATSTATGRKQHSSTATGGGEGVSSTAGGEELTSTARRKETIFYQTELKPKPPR